MEQKEIVGLLLDQLPHNHPLRMLRSTIRSSAQVPHAVLFSSTRFGGASLFAEYFAEEILEKDLGVRTLSRGVDVHVYEDLGETFSVKEARGLREALQVSPSGKRHMVVFPRMERLLSHNLTHEAANTLLKIIEEPLSPTVFLFTTEQEPLLLPTLLSRVYVLSVPLVSEDFLRRYMPEVEGFFHEAKGKLLFLLELQDHAFQQTWKEQKELVQRIFQENVSRTEKMLLLAPLFIQTKEEKDGLEGGKIGKKDLFFHHVELLLEGMLKDNTVDSETIARYYKAYDELKSNMSMNIQKKLVLYTFLLTLFPI